jgi:hypothetical protein
MTYAFNTAAATIVIARTVMVFARRNPFRAIFSHAHCQS